MPGFDEQQSQRVSEVAGCVIRRDDGKFLLVRERLGKAAGKWNIPAGHVDDGESRKDAAKREVREETGLDVEVGSEIDVWHTGETESVKYAFKAEITGGDILEETDEIQEVQWLTFEEIKALNSQGEIRAAWILEALSRVVDEH